MQDIRHQMVWLIVIIAAAALWVLARGYFNPEVRARRRRDKSNRPVISRKRGPTVQLAVDVDKPKREKKG
jgi:hypothetical protein